jgi:hypothetical protein
VLLRSAGSLSQEESARLAAYRSAAVLDGDAPPPGLPADAATASLLSLLRTEPDLVLGDLEGHLGRHRVRFDAQSGAGGPAPLAGEVPVGGNECHLLACLAEQPDRYVPTPTWPGRCSLLRRPGRARRVDLLSRGQAEDQAEVHPRHRPRADDQQQGVATGCGSASPTRDGVPREHSLDARVFCKNSPAAQGGMGVCAGRKFSGFGGLDAHPGGAAETEEPDQIRSCEGVLHRHKPALPSAGVFTLRTWNPSLFSPPETAACEPRIEVWLNPLASP